MTKKRAAILQHKEYLHDLALYDIEYLRRLKGGRLLIDLIAPQAYDI